MSIVIQIISDKLAAKTFARFPPEFYVAYLNTGTVQSAIGAYVNYTEFSAEVGDAFNATGDDGREDGTVEDMRELLDQGITVMMYTGDVSPSVLIAREIPRRSAKIFTGGLQLQLVIIAPLDAYKIGLELTHTKAWRPSCLPGSQPTRL